MRRFEATSRRGAAFLGLSLAMTACGTPAATNESAAPDAEAPDAAVQDAAVPDAAADETDAGAGLRCAPGQAVAYGQICQAAGLPRCNPLWRAADGTCRPAIEACGPDERPDIVDGCVHVGLPACDEAFRDAAGACRPAAHACPAGQRAASSSRCVPTAADTACDEAAYARFADVPAVLHVTAPDVAGAPDGDIPDGTRAHPFRSIQAALDAAVDGGTLVLAPGQYTEQIELSRNISIDGLCRDGVVLAINAPEPAPAWDPTDLVQGYTALYNSPGKESAIRNLTIRSVGAAFLSGPGDTTFENVRFLGGEHNVIVASDGHSLHLHDIEIEDFGIMPGYGLRGEFGAIRAMRGASVQIRGGVFHDFPGPAASLHGAGTALQAEDTLFDAVGDTDAEDSGLLNVVYGATANCLRCGFRQVRSIVGGDHSTSTPEIRQSVAYDFVARGTTAVVRAERGTVATLRDTVIVGAYGFAARASDRSALLATGNLIRDTHAGPEAPGVALVVRDGSTGELTANFIDGAEGTGVLVSNAHPDQITSARALRGVTVGPAEAGGAVVTAYDVRDDAELIVDEAVVVGARGAAIRAFGPAARQRVLRSEALDTQPARLPTGSDLGVAIAGLYGADVAVEGVRIVSPTAAGVLALTATLSLKQSHIQRPTPADSHNVDGTLVAGIADGVILSGQSTAAVQDCVIEDAARSGIVSDDSGGQILHSAGHGNAVDLTLQGDLRPTASPAENELARRVDSAPLLVPDGLSLVPSE